MMIQLRHVLLIGLLALLGFVSAGDSALKGTVVTYPPAPLVDATSCRTNVTTAYQNELCVDPTGLWICKTPATGGALDVLGNPLCNASAEWAFVTPTDTGAIAWSGDITPPTITANQDNYQPTGLSTAAILRLSTDASRDLRGLADGYDGRWFVLINVGTQNLTLRSEATSSTAANRFALTADISMVPNAMVLVLYDSTTLRWRAISSTVTAVAGGADVEKLPVAAATTGNINLSSPGAVHDGRTLSNGERLLVWQQTNATENGPYQYNGATSLLTRTTDGNEDSEFASNFSIKVQSGTLYGGVTFYLVTTGNISLGSSILTFGVQSWGTKVELLTSKGINSGYMGLGPTGNAPYDRIGSYAAHPSALSVGSQITVSARQMGIESSGGLVDLTSNPQIAPGTRDGTETELIGTHDTNTVKIDNGAGVRLCGNTGFIIVGRNRSSLKLKWHSALNVWQQTGCTSLQDAANVDRTLIADETTPIKICNATGTSCKSSYVDSSTGNPTESSICAGGACDAVIQLSAGKDFLIKKHDGTTLFAVDNDTGAVTGLSVKPQVLMGAQNGGQTGCGDPIFYSLPVGRSLSATDETQVQDVMNGSYTISNLRVSFQSAILSGETYVITYRKNEAATGLTCSVPAGQTSCTDTNQAHNFTVAAGDRLSVGTTCTGGTSSTPYFRFAVDMS
jgi:hypothetical protein